MSKRLGSSYRSGRSPHWVKVKNPKAPAESGARRRRIGDARRDPDILSALVLCVTKPFISFHLLFDFADPLFAQMLIRSKENVDGVNNKLMPLIGISEVAGHVVEFDQCVRRLLQVDAEERTILPN